MMKNLPTIIIILILLGAGIYWYQSTSNEVVQLTPGPDSGPTLELVRRVRAIKLDTSIFTDQLFLSLVSQPPLDVSGITTGRPNPFIPLRQHSKK